VVQTAKPFKFGWYGDGGLGERLIQLILDGRKTATICPEYDPVDAELRAGDALDLQDKHGKSRGMLVVVAVENRRLDQVDDMLAAAVGMPLADLRESLRFANGRELKADELLRVTFFRLVGTAKVKI
jgi:uncharacterized protein YhfF